MRKSSALEFPLGDQGASVTCAQAVMPNKRTPAIKPRPFMTWPPESSLACPAVSPPMPPFFGAVLGSGDRDPANGEGRAPRTEPAPHAMTVLLHGPASWPYPAKPQYPPMA